MIAIVQLHNPILYHPFHSQGVVICDNPRLPTGRRVLSHSPSGSIYDAFATRAESHSRGLYASLLLDVLGQGTPGLLTLVMSYFAPFRDWK